MREISDHGERLGAGESGRREILRNESHEDLQDEG